MSHSSAILSLSCVFFPTLSPIREYVGIFGKKIGPDFFILREPNLEKPLLLVSEDQNSPRNVLLCPEIKPRLKAKARKCCDEDCKDCQLPLLTPALTGYFLRRRLKEQFKTDPPVEAMTLPELKTLLTRSRITSRRVPPEDARKLVGECLWTDLLWPVAGECAGGGM